MALCQCCELAARHPLAPAGAGATVRDTGHVLALRSSRYDAQPAADRALITELASCRYLESATNVLLIGPPGCGQTGGITAPQRRAKNEQHDPRRTKIIEAAAPWIQA